MYNYSFNNIVNAMKVRAYGKPFYASDLGLNGGEINALKFGCYIKPTGNTRKVMVPIDMWGGDRIFKECEVKEWVWCRSNREWERVEQNEVLIQAVTKARELLELVHEMGACKSLGVEGF